MTIAADPAAPADKPRKRWPLILGVLLLFLGVAGGFSGLRALWPLLSSGVAPAAVSPDSRAGPAFVAPAFVEIEPIIVTLPRASGREFLRFAATLEVPADAQADVTAIMPRIIDVMNGYLRAVEPGDFESRTILADLRAQLLRRIQVVTGPERVTDLLVIEFILN